MKKTIYTVIARVSNPDGMETHELGSFDSYDNALARMIELRNNINARFSISLSFEE